LGGPPTEKKRQHEASNIIDPHNIHQLQEEIAMGWLNTALNAASLGADLYNAAQLSTLRRQGADAALIQAFIRHLRDQIFQFKQAADNALAMEARSPLAAAGAISVVADRLHDSGVTPELFPELGDKEYAAQTIRLIEENHRRLMARLTPAEQGEVARVVAAADRLPDYNYYLENYDDGRRLVEAAPAVEQYAGRNGWLLRNGFGLLYYFVGLPASIGLFVALFSGGNWSSNTGVIPGLVVGIGAWLAGAIMFSRWLHHKEYKEAKKVVDELKDKIDLPRFIALDNELGGTTQARQLQQEAQGFLAAFFGEPSIRAATTTTVGSRQHDQPAAPVDLPLRTAPPPQLDSTALEAPSSVTSVASLGAAPNAQRSNFCTNCGQPLTPGARFCMHCGTKVLSE